MKVQVRKRGQLTVELIQILLNFLGQPIDWYVSLERGTTKLIRDFQKVKVGASGSLPLHHNHLPCIKQ